MKKAKLTLRAWIQLKGLHEIAHVMNVDNSCVNHWRNGHSLPKARHMMEIHRLSRGAVSYKEMIETYFTNKAQK